MKRPSHVYSDSNSLWAFYNYVTIALQQSHPKTWMEDQRILHMFISEVNKFAPVSTPAPLYVATPIVTESEFVDPNQISLLDQIADLEADQMDEDLRYAEAELSDNQVVQNGSDFDIDLHQSEEIILSAIEAEETPFDLDAEDDAVLGSLLVPIEKPEPPVTVEEYLNHKESSDETVVYTDPAGNTFEAPIVIEENVEYLEEDVFAEADNFDLNFTEDAKEDEDLSPDFF